MRFFVLLLLLAVAPVRAAMDITRELVAPDSLVPGQPARIAVTFWTDSWFNPPPQWPDFKIENGALQTTPLPNQLLTRQKNGVSWSGVRFERQVTAWDQGTLRFPAIDLTMGSAGQAPVTVSLPALDKAVAWPDDVRQPDRFLPASSLTLTQKITPFYAGNDKTLHAGDAIERTVTAKATGTLPGGIPSLLYAIPGTETQRLTPVNSPLKTGRGDIDGAQRVETLRYLPSQAGTITLPPVRLRWWDTTHHQWQQADLPGASLGVAPARAAGREATLRGETGADTWRIATLAGIAVLFLLLAGLLRRQILRTFNFLHRKWHRFWHPVPLPDLIPTKRSQP